MTNDLLAFLAQITNKYAKNLKLRESSNMHKRSTTFDDAWSQDARFSFWIYVNLFIRLHYTMLKIIFNLQ